MVSDGDASCAPGVKCFFIYYLYTTREGPSFMSFLRSCKTYCSILTKLIKTIVFPVSKCTAMVIFDILKYKVWIIEANCCLPPCTKAKFSDKFSMTDRFRYGNITGKKEFTVSQSPPSSHYLSSIRWYSELISFIVISLGFGFCGSFRVGALN